jgi:hypothetical protein
VKNISRQAAKAQRMLHTKNISLAKTQKNPSHEEYLSRSEGVPSAQSREKYLSPSREGAKNKKWL